MAIEYEKIKKALEVPENPYDVKVTNIVFGVDLGGGVPLDRIATNLENAEYEPESFPGLVYRIPTHKATALVFTSGMCILSGINTLEKAISAAEKMIEDFKSIGITFEREVELKIVNLVVSANIHGILDLNKIVYELGDCEYEPEQFPGLIYRMEETGVVMLLFNSGRVIVTGSKSVSLSVESLRILEKKLKEIGGYIEKK